MNTLITQRKISNLRDNAGASYIIRLCDGRFILIDGGHDEYEEADRIFEILEKQNERGGKPVVAATIITHPHNDHIDALARFVRDYKDRVVFCDFIYKWPKPEFCAVIDNARQENFDTLVKGIDGAKVINVKTGDKLCYADAILDVLFTCEDLYPEQIGTYNDTSIVIRMDIAGKRILWMADAAVKCVASVLERYDESDLACDIFQVPHHGYGGGNTELHKKANPHTLLWSAPDYWYREVKYWEHNDYFLHSDKIKNIYVSGKAEVTLDLTADTVISEPVKVYDDNTIYKEDFNKTRVIDLGWHSLTSHNKKMHNADLTLKDGCIWKGNEAGVTVIEVINPAFMESVSSFQLCIEGKVLQKAEAFGAIYNNPRPTVWDDEKFTDFGVTSGDFKLDLTLNQQGGCGLYLVLQGGEVLLKSIKAIKIK